MKKNQFLIGLSLCLLGCKQPQVPTTLFKFSINSEEIKEVNISKYDFNLDKMVEFKSLTNLLPHEEYDVSDKYYEPSIYEIKLQTGKRIRVAVEDSGSIDFQLDEEIRMNSLVAQKSDFNAHIEELNNRFFADLITQFDIAMKEQDYIKIEELELRKDEVLAEFVTAMEKSVLEMGPSAIAYDALAYFDVFKNKDFLTSMTNLFEKEYPLSGMSRSMRKRMDKAAQVGIGSLAPSFSAMNDEKSKVDLTSFLGSYLLLDFWASWCRPCRVENPKLVLLHDEFKDIEFAIVSISIDADEALWKKAIDKDGMTWDQVLDSEHTIYKQYLLSSIPSNFLIDKEGSIIGQNYNAQQLKAELDRIREEQIEITRGN